MAGRKKSGTVTQTAIQKSEPRIMSMKQWVGINFSEKTPNWNPVTSAFADPNQTDLQNAWLVVQNNCACTPSKAIETRDDDEIICIPPDGKEFTGVACLERDNLFCAFTDNTIAYHVLGTDVQSWTNVPINGSSSPTTWNEIGYYAESLICMADVDKDSVSTPQIFIGSIATKKNSEGKYVYDTLDTDGVTSYDEIDDPDTAPTITLVGLQTGTVQRVQFCYVYRNIFGSTLTSPVSTVWTDADPVEWSGSKYATISGTAPTGQNITGIDIYVTTGDNVEYAWAGSVTLTDGGAWSFNWLGALADTSQWTNVSLEVPTENTTQGANARHLTHIDGRLYFWGGNDRYRLYIGGNPGNELSVARGVGGAYVDIEPGTGTYVSCVLKHKTYSASSIVTIMCGNENTGNVKRFNLLETSITVTNELNSKGYEYEEVSNVVGCNSRWGAGVFEDGLYSVSRYGLALTTHAMEYNNQLRVGYVSEQIKPIFTNRLGKRMNDARMVYIDGVVYIVLSEEDSTALDNVILCYDIALKAWYTYTYITDEIIEHVISIDSQEYWEGLGIITPTKVVLISMTSPALDTAPNFGDCYLETGELSVRIPPNETVWLEQIELDFDYFVGDAEIEIEGIDYYGRRFCVKHNMHLSEMELNRQEWVRIGMLIRTYHLKLKGNCRFRLFQMLQKTYVQSAKINLVYGLDSYHELRDGHGNVALEQHEIDSYNNLRRAIVP